LTSGHPCARLTRLIRPRLSISTLLCALLLAVSAQALGLQPATAGAAEVGGVEAPATTEGSSAVGEETAAPNPGASEIGETPPPSESVESPAPVETTETPPPSPISTETTETPSTIPAPVEATESPVAGPVSTEVAETTPTHPIATEAPESRSLSGEAQGASTSLFSDGSTASPATDAAGELPTAGAEAPIGSEATASVVLALEQVTAGNASARTSARRRAESLRCGLLSLDRSSSEGCAGGWLDPQQTVSAPGAGLVTAATSWPSSATAAKGDGGRGATAVSNGLLGSPSGPAPSGAAGASAVGGSGVAPSAFLTLAGLLLLAAPRAMRRLRLSCQSWRTAFFVLIPERPG